MPARIEITLAVDAVEEARDALRDLEEIVERCRTKLLDAMVAHGRGAVELAAGDATAALIALRRAWHGWRELGAPYEAARVRVLIGLACQALDDGETARLELEAGRTAFEQLGAAPDLVHLDALARPPEGERRHSLTPRELEVLRLVAAGDTNKAIATALSLSERTVDRHLSNIFDKLGVASRTAATAYAYEHQLL